MGRFHAGLLIATLLCAPGVVAAGPEQPPRLILQITVDALRGDLPSGAGLGGLGELRYANELVALIRDEFPEFGVMVAGYPETHQEAPSPDADLAYVIDIHRVCRATVGSV